VRYITFLTLVCVLLTIQFLPAQAPDTLWTKTYWHGEGRCVIETSDGGYVVASFDWRSPPKSILMKTDALGDTLWTKTFRGGGTYPDQIHSVQETSDGGYIAAGERWDDIVGWKVLLIKTNVHGDTLWTKSYGGGDDYGSAVQETSDNGYIIAGKIDYRSLGLGWDVWLIKTDSFGDTLWTKTYGDSLYDDATSIQQTSDGGYIVAGSKESFNSHSDVWLIKTDAFGDTLWTKTYGDTLWEGAKSIQQTSDGGYVVVGSSSLDSWPTTDLLFIKTDASGNTLWYKTFGGNSWDEGYSVQQTSDGGYIIVGGTLIGDNSELWLIRTDALGDTLWTKSVGDNLEDVGFSVRQTSDGGYIITGLKDRTAVPSIYMGSLWLIKIAPDPTSLKKFETMMPSEFSLSQNYPNPFNPSTIIEFDLPKTSEVTLKIFNILGQEVATLLSASLLSGSYEVEWDASRFASGVYLYRLQATDYVETRKMILMR
jgi:hypothetical protein